MRALVVSLLASTLVGGLAAAQQSEPPVVPNPTEQFTDWGRVTQTVPIPSNEGVWDGTWFYVSRDRRMALWFKTENGVPQVKLRYMSVASLEGFETDWEGKASYTVREATGNFSLGLKKRGADSIEGRWDWVLEAGKGARVEEGDFHMYRTGDGRYMAFYFDDLKRTVRGSKEGVASGAVSLTFIKVSKRLVLWDELPF